LKEQGLNDIGLKAKAIWCRPSLTQPYLENGLMFVDLTDESKETIESLIQIFALPDGTMKF
jgi:hypothetical protein